MRNWMYCDIMEKTTSWITALIFIITKTFAASYYDNNDKGYMSDLDMDWGVLGVRAHQPKCLDIPDSMTLCRNIGYKTMRLPNLLDHESMAEAVDQARVWVPLLNLHCHPDTQLFLCSLYSPVCLEPSVYPCRSLCEGVKKGCEERINNYGFPWPEILRCDKFPTELCIEQVNFENTANVCEPCKKPTTYESLLDSYCWSTHVFKVKIRKVVTEKNGDKRLILKGKVKSFKPKAMSKEEKASVKLIIRNGGTCECDAAERANGSSFITASKVGEEYVVTYISDWTKKKDFKRAVRAMRKGHDCKLQIEELPVQPDSNGGLSINGSPLPTVKGPEADNKTNGDKKDKKRRKGKDGKDGKEGKEGKEEKDDKDGKGKDKGKGKGKGKGNKKKKGNKDKTEDKNESEDPMANIAGIGCIPCKQPLVFENLIEKYCDSNFVIKARVRKIKMDPNGDKKLIVKKLETTDFYKQQNLTKRDIKKLHPVIGGGSSCDCDKAKKGNKLLIMGKKEGLRYVVNFLEEEAKDSEFIRFQNAIKKGYDCSGVKTTK